MRTFIPLAALIAAGLLSASAVADPSSKETTMKSKSSDTSATLPVCDSGDIKPHDGNGGYARGRNARAVGGTGNVGRDTGNGGVAIGANADASGGDANSATRAPCDGKTKLGNGGIARGNGAKASGGSGNIVRF